MHSCTRNIFKASALFACMQLAFTAEARTYAPRVVSQHNADAYSMKTFADHPQWRNLQGDAKANAMFNYLTDYSTGLYPLGLGSYENNETEYQFAMVRDPVKMINVYVAGYCDVLGPVMAGIWEDGGHGEARVVDIPEFEHVTAEVFYDGGWHYLDLDLRASFRRSDGSLASLAESQYENSLWNTPNGPRFFPNDNLNEIRNLYSSSSLPARRNVHESGHTMDFTLRQGESFKRWWNPQDGRWLHSSVYEAEQFAIDIIETAPRGPKTKHPAFTKHTYGNGRFIYQPNLTQASTDFADGVYDQQNIRLNASGFTLDSSGSGYAIFEVRTPYVIVPRVGDRANTNDDWEASVVEVDAVGASYSISKDNGITWQTIYQDGSYIDLTSQVAGEYGYLFKIQLDGQSDQAEVRSLRMTTWVQLAPASLPSLRQGSNRFEFRNGDHYGLQTQVVEIQPDVSDYDDFYKYLTVEPTGYTPNVPSSRVQGPFVMAVEAPPRKKIAWFSAGGSFQSYQGDFADSTRIKMDYAPEVPFSFNQFYNETMPTTQSHWHTNAQDEVILGDPASSVYIRYDSQPAVNNVRIYAHVVDDNPTEPSPVNITHEWIENGQTKTFNTSSTYSGSEYYINVNGSSPSDVSIEMSVDTVFGNGPVPPTEPATPGGVSTITWPTAGNTISDESVIYFSPGRSSFDEWRVTVGTSPGSDNRYDSGVKELDLNPWETTLTGLPSFGETVYLRFWQRRYGESWTTFDTTYYTDDITPPNPEPPTPEPPAEGLANISWPTAGNTLSADSVIYFSPGRTSFDEWRITVGTSAGSDNRYDSGTKELIFNPWEDTLSDLLSYGETVYLRFWQRNYGQAWSTFDTIYYTDDVSPPEPPTPEPPAAGLATISWPTSGNTIDANSTIYFSLGSQSFDQWRITVGPDASSQATLYDSGVKDLYVNPREQVLSGLQSTGGQVTLRFWQRQYGGQWSTFDTQYFTNEVVQPPVTDGLATFSWPFEGDVLSGDSTTFYFDPGYRYFDEWRITVRRERNAPIELYDSGVKEFAYNPWSYEVGALPTTGNIYVRFWQREYGGQWATFDTVYNTPSQQ